jgi:DNA-binding IclR family transcriptional regulator
MEKPFLYIFLLIKLKKKTKTKIVSKKFLSEQISRILIRKGGLPKFTIKYLIQDLVDLELLEKLNKTGTYMLKDHKQENKIKALLLFE